MDNIRNDAGYVGSCTRKDYKDRNHRQSERITKVKREEKYRGNFD